jgi:hypothetical protein
MTWIETFSGKRFDLLDPKPEQVDLADIAHALAQVNRFTGHTRRPYSVAEHSLYVWQVVKEEHYEDHVLQAHALLHDAAEAYVGDVSAPMKVAMREVHGVGVSWYDVIEYSVEHAIWKAFGLPKPTKEQRDIIKDADIRLLVTERLAFMPNTGTYSWGAHDDVKPVEHLLDRLWTREDAAPQGLAEYFAETMRGALLLAVPSHAG